MVEWQAIQRWYSYFKTSRRGKFLLDRSDKSAEYHYDAIFNKKVIGDYKIYTVFFFFNDALRISYF